MKQKLLFLIFILLVRSDVQAEKIANEYKDYVFTYDCGYASAVYTNNYKVIITLLKHKENNNIAVWVRDLTIHKGMRELAGLEETYWFGWSEEKSSFMYALEIHRNAFTAYYNFWNADEKGTTKSSETYYCLPYKKVKK